MILVPVARLGEPGPTTEVFKDEVCVFMRLVTWAGALVVATVLTDGLSAV